MLIPPWLTQSDFFRIAIIHNSAGNLSGDGLIDIVGAYHENGISLLFHQSIDGVKPEKSGR